MVAPVGAAPRIAAKSFGKIFSHVEDWQAGGYFPALRHKHASQLIAHGSILTISKRLGHAKPSVTLAVYADMFTSDDRKEALAWVAIGMAMFTSVLATGIANPLKIKVRRGGRVAEGGGLLNRYTV